MPGPMPMYTLFPSYLIPSMNTIFILYVEAKEKLQGQKQVSKDEKKAQEDQI